MREGKVMRKAIVMPGGQGSRLWPLTLTHHKPLVPVALSVGAASRGPPAHRAVRPQRRMVMPIIILSGIRTPVESMPEWLRYLVTMMIRKGETDGRRAPSSSVTIQEWRDGSDREGRTADWS
jgi:nucleotidyltransferase-like protein